jgi:hypothetical protein
MALDVVKKQLLAEVEHARKSVMDAATALHFPLDGLKAGQKTGVDACRICYQLTIYAKKLNEKMLALRMHMLRDADLATSRVPDGDDK